VPQLGDAWLYLGEGILEEKLVIKHEKFITIGNLIYLLQDSNLQQIHIFTQSYLNIDKFVIYVVNFKLYVIM